MHRVVSVAVAALAMLAPACGDDGKPDRTIAFLRSTEINPASQEAFLAELEAAGWTEGDNLEILSADPSEHHPVQDEGEEVVAGWIDDADVDLIIALSTTSAMAAAAVTDDVPVLSLANDLVGAGLVASPRAPEGNVSGVAFRVPPDRTLDVARQLAPGTPIGILSPSTDAGAAPLHQAFVDAADALDLEVVDAEFDDPADVAAAVATLDDAGVAVAALVNSSSTVAAYPELERALADAGIAAVANTVTNEFAVVVLAPESLAIYRQLGQQAVRVLDGTDLRDVPVEDPGEYELVVRTEVADRLGVEIPDDILDQADDLSG